MSVYAKLANVQRVLKAAKNQYNSFGKYKYRSCEDILEAAKPLCVEQGLVLTISDEIVMVGTRYYVKATATLTDIETGETITNTAYAREDENKKGMDGSQVTGASSSYSRKYSLNGLFCIDDTKDADTDENHTERDNRTKADQKQEQKKFVLRDGDKVSVLAGNGKYYPLSSLGLEQLNKIVNDQRFAECHNEARQLMASKG